MGLSLKKIAKKVAAPVQKVAKVVTKPVEQVAQTVAKPIAPVVDPIKRVVKPVLSQGSALAERAASGAYDVQSTAAQKVAAETARGASTAGAFTRDVARQVDDKVLTKDNALRAGELSLKAVKGAGDVVRGVPVVGKPLQKLTDKATAEGLKSIDREQRQMNTRTPSAGAYGTGGADSVADMAASAVTAPAPAAGGSPLGGSPLGQFPYGAPAPAAGGIMSWKVVAALVVAGVVGLVGVIFALRKR